MLAARAARPKLSLAVPSTTVTPAAGPKSPSPFALPVSPSPLTPTSRNTKFNKQSYSTLQVPSAAPRRSAHGKKVQFANTPTVKLVSPMPRECYGDYAKMSREERRWVQRSG